MKQIKWMITALLHLCLLKDGGATPESHAPDVPAALSSKQIKPGPPIITEQPKNTLAKSNENARLYCRAKGNPTPNISWLKDGAPLANAQVRDLIKHPAGDLMFLKVRDRGEGSTTGIYQCIASNEFGSVASRNVSVQVENIGEDFRRQPSDKIAAIGSTVTIGCQGPRGIPEPRISWRKNFQPLALNSRIKIKPGGDLRITGLRKSDSGSYQCVATNTAGTRRSTAAELRVREPPRFVVRPSDAQVEEGDSINLKCKGGGDPTLRIKWSRRRGRMPERFTVGRDGSLRMSDVTLDDEGEYVCSVENAVGKESTSVTLTVETQPEILRSSSTVTSQVNERVSLVCRVQGKPDPTLLWIDPLGNQIIPDGRSGGDRVRATSNGDLVITSVRFEDQGMYKCKAQNSIGTAVADIELRVRVDVTRIPPPIVTQPPFNRTVPPGSSALLKCSAADSTIRWYKNNKSLQTGTNRIRLLPSGDLKIENAQSLDGGKYSCSASNVHGIDRWDAWLNVIAEGSDVTTGELPGPPGRPVLLNSTSKCLTIEWSSTGNPKHHRFIVDYFRIGSGLSSWMRVSSGSQRLYEACHLQPSSEYVFVVRAVNQMGAGQASATSDYFKTKDAVANKELASIGAQLVRANSLPLAGSDRGTIRLQWESNGSCRAIDGFIIRWQALAATESNPGTRQVLCSSRIYDLTDLNIEARYEVRVVPVKGDELGRMSSIKIVSFNAGLISPSRSSLTAQVNSEDKEVTLQWTSPDDLPREHLIGYTLRYRSRDSSTQSAVNVSASTNQLVLTDLTAGTVYDFTITYQTKLGEGVTSEDVRAEIETSEASLITRPEVIAAIAGGVLVVVLVVVGVSCYCRKSRRKTMFHGKKRYNPSNFSKDFDMKMLTSQGPDLVPTSPTDELDHQYNYVQQDNLNTGDNLLGTTWPAVQPSTVQQLQRHQQLLRKRSDGSGYASSNPSEVNHRTVYQNSPFYSSPMDLPPPPPTPPVALPSPPVSQRSRASSGRHSTSDRSVRSGQRSHRSARGKRLPHPSHQLTEEIESSFETRQQHAPLLEGSQLNSVTTSSVPPTPPMRDDSTHQTYERNFYSNHRYQPVHSGSRVGSMDVDPETDEDQLGRLRSRPLNTNRNPRNSGNVSNVSLINGYGSESDARESLGDRHSAVSLWSDTESFHMESVSQVGQDHVEDDYDGMCERTRKGVQLASNSEFSKHSHPHTYHHYLAEVFIPNPSDPAVNPGGGFTTPNRKLTGKPHRSHTLTGPLDRANSVSTCSSYQQNTGDSGMSAGVGGSTPHSSSLKSHVSGASRDASNKVMAGFTPSNGDSHDGAMALTDVVASGSSYQPSNNQLPMKHSSRLPVSNSYKLAESKNYLKSNANRTPLSPILSPDPDLSYSEVDEISSDSRNVAPQFLTAKMVFSGEIGNKQLSPRFQNLSDVPEVSTSDFCEDFSDQSQ